MAIIALVSAGNMSSVFPCCCDAVMTRSASAQNLHMVDNDCRFEGDGVVAVFANIGRRNMHRALSRCRHAIVAGYTIADNSLMVEYRRDPCAYVMAVIALVARGDVRRCFSGGLNTVVAAIAAAG